MAEAGTAEAAATQVDESAATANDSAAAAAAAAAAADTADVALKPSPGAPLRRSNRLSG